jgi:hypothetical protein
MAKTTSSTKGAKGTKGSKGKSTKPNEEVLPVVEIQTTALIPVSEGKSVSEIVEERIAEDERRTGKPYEEKDLQFGKQVELLENSIPMVSGEERDEWEQRMLRIDLTPDPANIFGVEFIENTQEYLYKTLSDIVTDTPTEEYRAYTEEKWLELIAQYALSNLGEQKEIARIITDENVDVFKEIITEMVKNDPFRAHLMHLCSEAHQEYIQKLDDQAKRIVIDMTPDTPVSDTYESERTFILSEGKAIDIIDGNNTKLNGNKPIHEPIKMKEYRPSIQEVAHIPTRPTFMGALRVMDIIDKTATPKVTPFKDKLNPTYVAQKLLSVKQPLEIEIPFVV